MGDGGGLVLGLEVELGQAHQPLVAVGVHGDEALDGLAELVGRLPGGQVGVHLHLAHGAVLPVRGEVLLGQRAGELEVLGLVEGLDGLALGLPGAWAPWHRPRRRAGRPSARSSSWRSRGPPGPGAPAWRRAAGRASRGRRNGSSPGRRSRPPGAAGPGTRHSPAGCAGPCPGRRRPCPSRPPAGRALASWNWASWAAGSAWSILSRVSRSSSLRFGGR